MHFCLYLVLSVPENQHLVSDPRDDFAPQIWALNVIFLRLDTLIWVDLESINTLLGTNTALEQFVHGMASSHFLTSSRSPHTFVRTLPPLFGCNYKKTPWEEPLESLKAP